MARGLWMTDARPICVITEQSSPASSTDRIQIPEINGGLPRKGAQPPQFDAVVRFILTLRVPHEKLGAHLEPEFARKIDKGSIRNRKSIRSRRSTRSRNRSEAENR
jgi:hypothetical protein